MIYRCSVCLNGTFWFKLFLLQFSISKKTSKNGKKLKKTHFRKNESSVKIKLRYILTRQTTQREHQNSLNSFQRYLLKRKLRKNKKVPKYKNHWKKFWIEISENCLFRLENFIMASFIERIRDQNRNRTYSDPERPSETRARLTLPPGLGLQKRLSDNSLVKRFSDKIYGVTKSTENIFTRHTVR